MAAAAAAALLEAAAAPFVADDVADDDVEVGAAAAPLENGSGVLSEGHASPGCSIKLEFSASSRCSERKVDALGLITPTIP